MFIAVPLWPSTVVLSTFSCQSHVLLSSPRVLHPLPRRRSRALPPQASLGSRHPGASPTSHGRPQVPRRDRCWGSNSILHDPLGLSLRSKVSLSVGGSEPGGPVPLRSMSDPDQDFDKEVCVPPAQKAVATRPAECRWYFLCGESTSSPVTQSQLIENWNKEDTVQLGGRP